MKTKIETTDGADKITVGQCYQTPQGWYANLVANHNAGVGEAWGKTEAQARARAEQFCRAPALADENERLRAALEKIAKWHGEFPYTGKTWDDGKEMSYGAAFGSNGERDYMRSVACDALAM